MRTRSIRCLTAAAFALATLPSFADDRALTTDAAQEIAAGAVEACQARGFLVSATVVDRAGQILAVLRANGAGAHTPESSRRKAYTAVSLRNSTSAVLQATQTNPGAANLVFIPEFLILAGGVTIRAGNEVIGAVGVGGAPSGQFDEQCAEAGLAKQNGRKH